MAKLVKQHISNNGAIAVELYDKTNKNADYNWLVEFAVNGRSTMKSKPFVEKEKAEEYYDNLVTDDFIPIM